MARILFLDAAGTLIHPAEPVGAVYARHFRDAGVDVPAGTTGAAFARIMASAADPSYDAHPSGHEAERRWWEALVREVLRACGPDGSALAASEGFGPCFEALYDHYAEASAWVAFPDVEPFLEAAGGAARLGVVSNFDARLPAILDGLGLAPCFETVVTSGDAGARKPDPAIFRFALRRFGASPEDVAHAGDSLRADVEGARAAGLTAFHLRRPDRTLLDFLDFCEFSAT